MIANATFQAWDGMLNASQVEVQVQPVQLVSLNKTQVLNNVMLFKNSFENCGKRGYYAAKT